MNMKTNTPSRIQQEDTERTESCKQSRFSVDSVCSCSLLLFFLTCAGSALAGVHYVDVNSTNATPPYTNWTTAATNIQDAVDAAVAGDEIVVTNGAYYSIFVDKPLSVRSVNGPQSATIWGDFDARCAYLLNGASISGFTLMGAAIDDNGGGLIGGVASNCIIAQNSALGKGGGAYGARLIDCVLSNNWSGSGPSGWSTGYGGGAYGCTLINCTLASNYAGGQQLGGYGGGAADCVLTNCVLVGNSADLTADSGGGDAYLSQLFNCTLVGNSDRARCCLPAPSVQWDNWIVVNCIIFLNLHYGRGLGGPWCEGCDSPGQPGPGSSWLGDPLFVDYAGGNLRLQSNSPCINAGNNTFAPAGPDLHGNPRIAGGTVDIGAYEFQAPASQISYAWLQQYGLPINSSTDTADPDGDAVDNYHEWLAGSNPTNSLSSPAQLTITPSGVPPSGIILTWSTNAVGFTLQSTTNRSSLSAWATNSPAPVIIAGQNTVTNPLTGAQKFYRLIH